MAGRADRDGRSVNRSCKTRGRKPDRPSAAAGRAARQAWQQVGRPRRREPSARRAAPPQGAPAARGVASRGPAFLAGDRAGGQLAAAAPTWLLWWSRWGWSGVSAPGGPAHRPRPASGTPVPAPPGQAPAGGRANRAGVGGAGRRESAVRGCGRVRGLAGPGGAPTAQPCLRAYGDSGAQGAWLAAVSLATGNSAGVRLRLGCLSRDLSAFALTGFWPHLSELLRVSDSVSMRPAPAPQTCPGRWSSSRGSSAAGSCPRRSCRPSSESCRAASVLPSGR